MGNFTTMKVKSGRTMKEAMMMGSYFFDFFLISLLVIGITALNGVFLNGLGIRVFGGKNRFKFKNQSAKTQTGWKNVGGNINQ